MILSALSFSKHQSDDQSFTCFKDSAIGMEFFIADSDTNKVGFHYII